MSCQKGFAQFIPSAALYLNARVSNRFCHQETPHSSPVWGIVYLMTFLYVWRWRWTVNLHWKQWWPFRETVSDTIVMSWKEGLSVVNKGKSLQKHWLENSPVLCSWKSLVKSMRLWRTPGAGLKYQQWESWRQFLGMQGRNNTQCVYMTLKKTELLG